MIAEIQLLPTPVGTPTSRAHVDAAIDATAPSGLTDEVGPLGTDIEGATGGVTIITVVEASTMQELTHPHRDRGR